MSTSDTIVWLDDGDLSYSAIRANVQPRNSPTVKLGDRLTLGINGHAVDQPLAIADAVLAAVTEWHAEIHRRGHGDPVEPLLAELATATADRDEALARLGEADGQAQATGALDARRACAEQLADATRDRVAIPDDVRDVLERLIDEWRYR